jgi:hypothetical protein
MTCHHQRPKLKYKIATKLGNSADTTQMDLIQIAKHSQTLVRTCSILMSLNAIQPQRWRRDAAIIAAALQDAGAASSRHPRMLGAAPIWIKFPLSRALEGRSLCVADSGHLQLQVSEFATLMARGSREGFMPAHCKPLI